MNPKRLIEPGSESTELERLLLEADLDPKPDPAEEQLVWGRLVATLLPPTDPGGGGGTSGGQDSGEHLADPAAGGGAATAFADAPERGLAALAAQKSRGVVTLLVNHGIGFFVGVAAATSFFLLRPAFEAAPQRPTTVTPPTVETLVAPPRGEGSSTRGESTGAESAPPAVTIEQLELERTPSANGPPASASSPAPVASSEAPGLAHSRLREEAALIRQAREALSADDLAAAEQALAVSRRKFPEPVLEQEREALTIELMRRKGLASEAASLARDFTSKYPHSPHARQVERALSVPEQAE